MLYTQMLYLEKLFDLQKAAKEAKSGSIGKFKLRKLKSQDQILGACRDYSQELNELKTIVTRSMDKNARMYVDLKSLFSFSSVVSK